MALGGALPYCGAAGVRNSGFLCNQLSGFIGSDLLEEAVRVPYLPFLCDFPASKTSDADAGRLHALARRRKSHQRAPVVRSPTKALLASSAGRTAI